MTTPKAPAAHPLGEAAGYASPERMLLDAGWQRRGNLWVSPYTGSVQNHALAVCIEKMEACDRETHIAAGEPPANKEKL